MKRNILYSVAIVALTLTLSLQVNAQVAINSTGDGPVSSAMLDISSTTGGVLVPRMTAAQRTAIGTPATGLLVYQTDAPAGFYFYNGAAWMQLTGGGAETDPIVTAVNGIVMSNGTTISAATAGDFPTLNQNTTGTASNVTGVVDISNGGTGDPTGTNLIPDQSSMNGRYLQTNGTTASWVTVALGGVSSVTPEDGSPIYVNNNDPANPKLGLYGVIPTTYGGTGYNSFAVGDILYADTPTSLSKLPATAVGNALISQGVDAAPIWGKIDLATTTNGTSYKNITTNAVANYTIKATDNVIICTVGGTVTLPSAGTCKGKVYQIKNIASTNITISTSTSTQKIDVVNTTTSLAQYKAAELISDGGNWYIISAK